MAEETLVKDSLSTTSRDYILLPIFCQALQIYKTMMMMDLILYSLTLVLMVIDTHVELQINLKMLPLDSEVCVVK